MLGQFLFAALGSICREAQLAPNLVGTPNDIREWMAYRSGRSRDKHGNPPQLARGWRAEFVGRLFEDLLAGKLSIRVADPKSDHPLVFEPHEGGGGQSRCPTTRAAAWHKQCPANWSCPHCLLRSSGTFD